MKSSNFVYSKVGENINQFLPAASLEYSDKFWSTFEPYFFDNKYNVQSFVGELVKIGQDAIKCIFKLSQVEDSIVLHEYTMLRRAAEVLGPSFPHICRPYGIVKYKSHIDISKGLHVDGDEEPFVYRDALLLEYVPYITDFCDFVQLCTKDDVIINLFKQVLMCIRAFRLIGLTHYDLHTCNILVKACSEDLVLKYIINDTTFEVATLGYIVVIIDFGYSYIEDKDEGCLYANLRNVDHGLMPDRFMPYTDYIRFIHNFASNTKHSRSNCIQKTRRRALSIFHTCAWNIIKKNGWEKTRLPDLIKVLDKQVYGYHLVLFETYDWIEALQMLIDVPLKPAKSSRASFDTFTAEWRKIEERVTSFNLLTYLFKYLVRTMKIFKSHEHFIDVVKSGFLDEFTRLVTSFLPALDYSLLITSIDQMSTYLGGFLCRSIQARQKELYAAYESLPFKPDLCDDYIWNVFVSFTHVASTENVLVVKVKNEAGK